VQRFRNPDHLAALVERSLRKLEERLEEGNLSGGSADRASESRQGKTPPSMPRPHLQPCSCSIAVLTIVRARPQD
jgi:hypothetical protein